MPLVKAQCTNCNAPLEVDDNKEAAICPHCGTPYIVEKAINYFEVNNTFVGATININPEIQSGLDAAEALVNLGETLKAYRLLKNLTTKFPQSQEAWINLVNIRILFWEQKMKNNEVEPDLIDDIPEFFDAKKIINSEQSILLDKEYNNFLKERNAYKSQYVNIKAKPFFEKFKTCEEFNEWLKLKNKRLVGEYSIPSSDKYIYYSFIPSEKLLFKESSEEGEPMGLSGFFEDYEIKEWNSSTGEIVFSTRNNYTLYKYKRSVNDKVKYSFDTRHSRANVIKLVITDYSSECTLSLDSYPSIKNGFLIGRIETKSGKWSVKFSFKDFKKQGCYIATCVYGSYDCPEVWTLRRFRDNNLDKTWFGRLFIKSYYAVSPSLVKIFGKQKWFIKIVKYNLDKMVKYCREKGLEDSPYIDKY